MIHVRFEGRSYELNGSQLGLTPGCSDSVVKDRLARFLEVAPGRLVDYVIDRRPNGTLVIRPEAVYG